MPRKLFGWDLPPGVTQRMIDEAIEQPGGHQSYCAAVRHAGEPCDCDGYGEYEAAPEPEGDAP